MKMGIFYVSLLWTSKRDVNRLIKISLCTWWLQHRMLTNNVQSVPLQSPNVYLHIELISRRQFSVQHSPHSECILWWPNSNHLLCREYSNTLSVCTVIIKYTYAFWSPWISHFLHVHRKVSLTLYSEEGTLSENIIFGITVNKSWKTVGS
jgi:hypothetical protein